MTEQEIIANIEGKHCKGNDCDSLLVCIVKWLVNPKDRYKNNPLDSQCAATKDFRNYIEICGVSEDEAMQMVKRKYDIECF